MDTLDIEIIRILQKNARTPFSVIAKTLHVPASVVQIRFNKMKKAGIILGTTLTLNQEKFGIKYAVSLGVMLWSLSFMRL
jgi:Lrp/AsnC family transcriptional regulator for asnA, asnC and gidA